MGPLADAMGINIALAFWIAVAQLPVMVGLALHYPTVRIDLYDTSIRLAVDSSTNQTAIAAMDATAVRVSIYEHGVGISGLYVVNAASFAFFTVLTMNFMERGMAAASDDHRERVRNVMASEDYVLQNIGMLADPTFRTWNQVGWSCVHAFMYIYMCRNTTAIFWLLTHL
jgi:hypothetical protein